MTTGADRVIRCPKCNTALESLGGHAGTPFCPSCESVLHVPDSYFRLTSYLILAVVIVIGALTHRPGSGGAWLFWLILLWIPLRVICFRLIPPPLELGAAKSRIKLWHLYVAFCPLMFAYYYVLLGWLSLLLGSHHDLLEQLDLASFPLNQIDRAFEITPQRSFLDVVGTIMGNTYFFSVLIYWCWRAVHTSFNRSRVTQIGITDNTMPEEEDL